MTKRRTPRRPYTPLTLEELQECTLAAIAEGTGSRVAYVSRERLQGAWDKSWTAAYEGRALVDVAFEMVRELLVRPFLTGTAVVLNASFALDRLAAKNGHVIDWHDAEEFEDISAIFARGEDAASRLLEWLRDAVSDQNDSGSWESTRPEAKSTASPGGSHAFVLSPMTGLSPELTTVFRDYVRVAAGTLRRLGFTVHAPAERDLGDRQDADISSEDIAHASKADLIVAFVCPPALGVGMLLMHSDRVQSQVLILGQDQAEVSPISAVLSHRSSLEPFTAAEDIERRIRQKVLEWGPILDLRAAARQSMDAALRDEFERLRIAVRAAEILGTLHEAPLPRDRVLQLAGSIDVFRSAYVWELLVLADFLGLSALSIGSKRESLAEPIARQSEIGPPARLPVPRADEQLVLFEEEHDRSWDLVAPPRPAGWQDKPRLSASEVTAALRAARRLKLNDKQKEELVLLGAGRRCDEYALSLAARNHLPLTDPSDWAALWSKYRGE